MDESFLVALQAAEDAERDEEAEHVHEIAAAGWLIE